jgi:hypothetical protein
VEGGRAANVVAVQGHQHVIGRIVVFGGVRGIGIGQAVAVVVGVQNQRVMKLLEVREARRPPRRFTRPRKRRQQDSEQHRDDRDDHQHLNERKSTFAIDR